MGRVLVLDEQGRSRDQLVEALSMDGHETRATASASDALTYIGNGEVDVLISEVRLPGVLAWSLFPDVHRLDPEIPVIALSADDSWETSRRVRAEAGPVFFYALKPVDLKEMRLVTVAAVRWRHRRDGI